MTEYASSRLRAAAEQLPARARIGLTLVAGELALSHLKWSPDYPLAESAVELARRWYDGERFDPDIFDDVMMGEPDRSLVDCEIEAKSLIDRSAWMILEGTVAYTAFEACREVGATPSEPICEVDETIFDVIESDLHVLSPTALDTVLRAVEPLKRNPDLSFAQLKAARS
jgi:hypothetical protein